MRERNGSWVMVIGFAMAVYGGAVIWSMFTPIPMLNRVDRLIIAILITGIGAYGFLKELLREQEDTSPNFLAQAIEPFVAAWSRLWRTKWLLWIYGSIAIISSFSNGIVSYLAYRHFRELGDVETSRMLGPGVPVLQISSWLQESLQGVTSKFLPWLHLFRGAPLYVLMLFCLVWWALPRIARLSGDAEFRRKAGVLSVWLVVAALAGIVWIAVWTTSVRWLWLPPGQSKTLGDMALSFWPITTLIMTMEVVILHAAMTGGVIGALTGGSVPDIRTAFLSSSVRCFAPLALFWLIVQGANLVPDLLMHAIAGVTLTGRAQIVSYLGVMLYGIVDVALLLLMFAPFSVVIGGRGAIDAIRESVGLWKRMWQQAVGLVAVGGFMQGLTMLLLSFGWLHDERKVTIWSIPVGFVASILEVALGLIVMLALLEFYRAKVTASESASVVESGPSP